MKKIFILAALMGSVSAQSEDAPKPAEIRIKLLDPLQRGGILLCIEREGTLLCRDLEHGVKALCEAGLVICIDKQEEKKL